MYTGNSIAESEKSAKYAGLAEGYDYIATKDVSFEQKIEYDNGVRIPFDSTFKRAYKDSVLMCIEGGSAGRKIGILDRDVCFGNKLCMFRADKVLNTYLFYYFTK
jgi:type I restriction enzyme S subunit